MGPAGPAGAAGTPGAAGAAGRPVPKTGDEANMNLWMMLFALGLVGGMTTGTVIAKSKRQFVKAPLIMIKGDDGEDKCLIL
jgi:hypothetical protein